MPSQWWISLDQVRLPVRMEHIHAVVTRWFDVQDAHWSKEKPYSVSPLSERNGEYGFQLGLMIDELSEVLLERLYYNPAVQLGNHHSQVSTAEQIGKESWSELGTWSQASRWRVSLLTPTTHRSGSRNSPLPNLPAIVRRLSEHWSTWNQPVNVDLHQLSKAMWVSDLQLSSTTLEFHQQVISGSLGEFTIRCNDRKFAAFADQLLRLAPYSGIGSFTVKGCGVCEVNPIKA